MRPSVGRSRSIFCPPHARECPVDRAVLLLQPVAELGLEQAQLGVGDRVGVERPEEIRVLVDDFQARDGRVVDQPRAGRGVGRQEQGLPPLPILLLELLVEEERGEGKLLAVVALEPGRVGLRLQPEREVDREVAVDPLGLHRLDDVEGVPDRGQVDVALVVEVTVVDPDEVDAVLGQHPCLGAQVVASLARRPVDGPEPDRFARPGVDELRTFDSDEAAVAGRLLVQGPQIDAARIRERVGLGVEGEPALVRLGHAA